MIKYLNNTTRLIFCLLLLSLTGFGCKEQLDLLITGGLVYDGKGNPGQRTDIGIKGDKIVALGNLNGVKSKKVIDASGLAVSPGFIDLHAHIESIMNNPTALSKLHQGVTTVLGGPDGFSPYPLGAHLDSLKNLQIGVNVGYLIGHNTIRKLVMGLDNRAPTDEEMIKMEDMVKQGMEDGAFGISTGLKYLPGTFSKADEIIKLSTVAADYGGFYTSHLREEGLGLLDGVREAIMIADKAKIPVVLTHHKVVGKPSWGMSRTTLAIVDSANTSGLDIQLDQYPYTASYTGISILIPSWAMAGGTEEFKKRTANREVRKKIKDEIVFNILNDRGGGDIKNVQLSGVSWQKDLENKTLADWAVMRGLKPTPENGAELIIEAQEKGGASAIFHAMSEEDVRRIMKYPKTMIASDGRLSVPGKGHPHPRVYGTNPRVLGKYVREEGVLKLEEAIGKMTYLPAKRMGLSGRGVIETNTFADIVIFDPETVIDKSTFASPHQYPEGINYVIVNGVISIAGGEPTDNYNGQVLKREKNK